MLCSTIETVCIWFPLNHSKQNEVIVQNVKNYLESDNQSSITLERQMGNLKQIKWEPSFIKSHNNVKFGWNQSRNSGVRVWFVKIVLNIKVRGFITLEQNIENFQKNARELPFTNPHNNIKFEGYQLRNTGVHIFFF